MVKACRNHPDASIIGLDAFLKTFPEDDFKSRLKYSEMVFPLYAQRPDLQIAVRTWQCKQLENSGDPLKTLSLALQTCIDNAEESKLILPLVRICIDIVKEKELQARTARYFNKIDKSFPKTRGGEPSEAYAEFREMLKELGI